MCADVGLCLALRRFSDILLPKRQLGTHFASSRLTPPCILSSELGNENGCGDSRYIIRK